MRLFLCLASDCVSIPEDERIDPLVTMPAIVLPVSQQLPLATARNLLFHSNYATQNHFLFSNVVRELRRFLLDSFLLHYLAEANGIGSDQIVVTFESLLFIELSLEAPQHIGI